MLSCGGSELAPPTPRPSRDADQHTNRMSIPNTTSTLCHTTAVLLPTCQNPVELLGQLDSDKAEDGG